MNTIIAFLHEMWVRFTLKSPKFAAKVQWVAGILVILIPSLIATASSAGWGWDLIIVNLVIIKVTLVQFLGYTVMVLTGVFISAKMSVENRQELDSKIKESAPSSGRLIDQ